MKYLFSAIYKDGSRYNQNPQDVSIQDPLKSCFYDIDQARLKEFILYNDTDEYKVDIESGLFTVNGAAFCLHDRQVSDMRLIYYRENKIVFTMGASSREHQVKFCFGWQGDVDGRNVKYILKI